MSKALVQLFDFDCPCHGRSRINGDRAGRSPPPRPILTEYVCGNPGALSGRSREMDQIVDPIQSHEALQFFRHIGEKDPASMAVGLTLPFQQHTNG